MDISAILRRKKLINLAQYIYDQKYYTSTNMAAIVNGT